MNGTELHNLATSRKIDALVVPPCPERVSAYAAERVFIAEHFADGAMLTRQRPVVVYPNGSTIRVCARPGLVDLVGISLDIALVFGPVDPDASREIDYRLIGRNGKRYGWRHE